MQPLNKMEPAVRSIDITNKDVTLSLVGGALATLTKIGSTGHDDLDADVLLAEQALRRVKVELSKREQK